MLADPPVARAGASGAEPLQLNGEVISCLSSMACTTSISEWRDPDRLLKPYRSLSGVPYLTLMALIEADLSRLDG